MRLTAPHEDTLMEKNIRIIKKNEKLYQMDETEEYIENPEESIKILEKLREEAMVLLYGNKTSFQRTINVTRRK